MASSASPDNGSFPISSSQFAEDHQIVVPTIQPPFLVDTIFAVLSRRGFQQRIEHMVQGLCKELGRPPTQEEVSALAESSRYAATSAAYGKLGSLAAASFMVWRGRKTFRFPLYSPRFTSTRPLVFPHRMFPFISGNSAEVAWHITRGIAYFFVLGELLIDPVILTLGSIQSSAAASNDPRLQAFRRDLSTNLQQHRGIRREPFGFGGGAQRYEQVVSQYEQEITNIASRIAKNETRLREIRDAPGAFNKTEEALVESEIRKDTERIRLLRQRTAELRQKLGTQRPGFAGQAQPAPESAPEDAWSSASDTAGEEQRSPQDAPAAPQAWERQQRSTGQAVQPPPPQPSTESTWDDPFDEDDDASPVARAHRGRQPGSAASPAGESAWDRLRRQTQSGQPPERQTPSPRPSAWEDGAGSARRKEQFSYTKAEEEAALAKEQAQKEFDEMLERERRGDGDDKVKGSWGRRK